jgi:hypothetical protein
VRVAHVLAEVRDNVDVHQSMSFRKSL